MYFIEALKLLNDEENNVTKIARRNWGKDEYLAIYGTPWQYAHEERLLRFDDFITDDWEIIKEKEE